MKQWVIDTWVLIKSDEPRCTEYLDCLYFLLNIMKDGIICLDTEAEIIQEYYRYMKPGTFLSRWWESKKTKNHFMYFSHTLYDRHRQKLEETLKFDKSDTKFVGVASKTADKLLVSGDSDYSDEICGFLRSELNIQVLEPKDTINII